MINWNKIYKLFVSVAVILAVAIMWLMCGAHEIRQQELRERNYKLFMVFVKETGNPHRLTFEEWEAKYGEDN